MRPLGEDTADISTGSVTSPRAAVPVHPQQSTETPTLFPSDIPSALRKTPEGLPKHARWTPT